MITSTFTCTGPYAVNHPRENMTPSIQGHELTIALKRLGEALGVPVLHHVIIDGGSFAVI